MITSFFPSPSTFSRLQRDARSRTSFEQMKGRGTRALMHTDLQAVRGADANYAN
jgi:hypothetical protein